MERSDGALARVTYLPGVVPPAPEQEKAAATPPSDRPTFAALYPNAATSADDADADDADADDTGADDTGADLTAADDGDSGSGPDSRRDPLRQRDRAENVSMHALTRRGISKRELERTLRSRDLDDDVIADELERLERVGLIDDVALAQNLVGVLQERKGLGRTGIAAELTRRLLSPAAIEYALELVDTGDELGRAREIAVKRAGQLTSYDHATAVRRLSAFLMRRGYSGSTVRAAVEHAIPARGNGSSVKFR
ncbi:hypothetical protein BH11ACT3_BH11ACT3_23290 [soil metagenome]